MDQPLPSQMPGMRYVGVPPQFRHHPLLSAAPYFTLPGQLLKHVVAQVGEERFNADLLKMEYALSDVCGDHSSYIGFWGGQPIRFLLLRPKNDLADDSFVQGMSKLGKSADEARAILAVGEQRLDWTADVRRGYCGWLMTNRAFLDEHRQVFADLGESSGPERHSRDGTSGARCPGHSGCSTRRRAECSNYVRAFEEFFIRWRLEGMPAPFVPQPMGVHLPVVDLRPVLGHMRQGGTTFYIPDICPVPSRDKLREILEEALRDRHAPGYLAEWFEIVHSDNAAKNQIPRYGRVFELQHYLRALYARHAEALERKKSAIIIAISEYLGVSDDTIERDLSFIADRLGPDWYLRLGLSRLSAASFDG